MESLPEAERAAIFTAYIKSLNEDPEQYRKDAAKVEQLAGALSGPDGLTPDASGTDLQVRRAGAGRMLAGCCVCRNLTFWAAVPHLGAWGRGWGGQRRESVRAWVVRAG
jgi:hypothetical protein